MTEFNHVTVLLEEAVEQLNIKPDQKDKIKKVI